MDFALHEHAIGLSWTVEDEPLVRASHALVAGGKVWFIDPVDHAPAIERALEHGPAAGVLQLLDRHPRDCAAVAQRLGVDLLRLPRDVPGMPFELFDVVSVARWRERGLWWAEREVLIVPEALGSVRYYNVGTGQVGVHPFLRLRPPRHLGRFTPEHLLLGHGRPVHGRGTTEAVRDALARSWRDLPRVPLAVLRSR